MIGLKHVGGSNGPLAGEECHLLVCLLMTNVMLLSSRLVLPSSGNTLCLLQYLFVGFTTSFPIMRLRQH